jgi:hypothetical protein
MKSPVLPQLRFFAGLILSHRPRGSDSSWIPAGYGAPLRETLQGRAGCSEFRSMDQRMDQEFAGGIVGARGWALSSQAQGFCPEQVNGPLTSFGFSSTRCSKFPRVM